MKGSSEPAVCCIISPVVVTYVTFKPHLVASTLLEADDLLLCSCICVFVHVCVCVCGFPWLHGISPIWVSLRTVRFHGFSYSPSQISHQVAGRWLLLLSALHQLLLDRQQALKPARLAASSPQSTNLNVSIAQRCSRVPFLLHSSALKYKKRIFRVGATFVRSTLNECGMAMSGLFSPVGQILNTAPKAQNPDAANLDLRCVATLKQPSREYVSHAHVHCYFALIAVKGLHVFPVSRHSLWCEGEPAAGRSCLGACR